MMYGHIGQEADRGFVVAEGLGPRDDLPGKSVGLTDIAVAVAGRREQCFGDRL